MDNSFYRDIPGERKEFPRPPHRFGHFVIPKDCHIKGFSEHKIEEFKTEIWHLAVREEFRAR